MYLNKMKAIYGKPINSKYIKDQNIRSETINILEENIKRELLNINIGMIFLIDTKSKGNKSKNKQVGLNQTKKLLLSKERGFSDSSVGKESACNAGDPGSMPGLGRCPGEGKG